MSWPDDEIEELKQYGAVSRAEEGGMTYFLLPQLQLFEWCVPTTVDALLCPNQMDGYTSRLFFSEKIDVPRGAKQALNWNAIDRHILGRNWHAISWKINRTDLRLAQMVANHLSAFR